MQENNFKSEIENLSEKPQKVISDFLEQVGAKVISETEFNYKDKKWFIDFHPFDHSDDIIVSENIINKYDNFLLVKSGALKTRIAGWCSRKQLLSVLKRDIYRNGKFYYMVVDTNLKDLTSFEIESNKILKEKFIINKQTAENLGHKEMISGILAGLHSYAKQCNLFFKDINQKDECMIGEKRIKIYTRDMKSDEDMLIYESYYTKHPEIDIYICCRIKANEYKYVGYVEKEVVDNTRIVKMIGSDSDKESSAVRRIFAEQYKNLSKIFEIYEDDEEEEIIIEQNYIPLHVHTEWSVGDGFGTCKQIAEQLYKKGFKGCAITDHGTLAGVWEFQKALLEKGLKPIIGYEAYIKIPELEKRSHITIIIKNEKGWKNILKIHDCAVREDFYYKPIVNYEKLIEHSEGLIIISGCGSGILSGLFYENDFDTIAKYIKNLKEVFKDDFYGEIQPTTVIDNQSAMKYLYKEYSKNEIKSVFTNDCHYINKEDKEVHDAVKAISLRKKYGEAGFGDDCFYLMQDDDIKERLDSVEENNWMKEHIDELKKNTIEIFDKVEFKIVPPEELDTLPKFLPTIEERKKKLKEICLEGLEKNTKYKYEGEIKERLDLEVNRILSKNYENYFLIVWDLIKWAKENKIFVGPGRGSVGASLAAYALNITDCDPIEFDLLFDRFLSEIRRDMPDVDMDFQDNRRQEVFKYLEKKYGKKNTAKVATYSRFHPKGILRDIGRIFNIPIFDIEKVCKLVLERSGGDARASFGLMDTFEEFEEAREFKIKYPQASKIAVKLEGHIRHKGIHAAAMVVCEREISDYVPVGRLNGVYVTEWEKQQVEDMKLIKFDVLGLKTLSVISDCINDLNVELPKTFEDEEVYKKVFHEGDTLGVFQFETVGLGKLSQSLKPNTFSTLYDATTLFRPGALHCLDRETLISTQIGEKRICDLKETDKVKCYIKDKKRSRFEMLKPIKFGNTGNKVVYEIKTEDGVLLATAEHRILTKKGFKFVKNLTEDDEILMCINPSLSKFKKNNKPWNKNLKGFSSEMKFSKIKSIKKIGKRETWDIEMPYPNNYVANKFVVHNSGQTGLYTNRHLGKDEIKYEHPLLEEITSYTKGIILYQEQIMQVMNKVGGMSWATAEMARKVITKSKGKKAFEEMRAEFVRNAHKLHDMGTEEAEKLYDVVSTFGCLTGDTKIYRASSNQYSKKELSLKDAYEYQKSDNFKHRGLKILAMSADGFVRPHRIKKIYDTGNKPIYYLRTSSNKNIKASENHRFCVNGNWIKLKNIKVGDLIRVSDLRLSKKIYGNGSGSGNHKDCPRERKGFGKTNEEKIRKSELKRIFNNGCQICSSKKFVELHHIDKKHSNNSKENTMLLCRKHHKEYENSNLERFQKGHYTHWESVEEIKYSSDRQTYDIEMEDSPRNFIANNFVSHNSYGFNKAHAVEYSIISYWCAWLKTYYPETFFKNILKHESDDVKIMNYLDDAHKNGVEILYPHINNSEFESSAKDKKIYCGFSSIKGIGAKTAEKIMAGQPYESVEDFKKKAKVGKKIFQGLIISDCFRDFDINKKSICEEKVCEDYSDLEWAEKLMQDTTLKPKINIKDAIDFGDYEFIDIGDLKEEHGGKIGCIRGFVTNILNKDKLIRGELKDHMHKFEQHMIYLNINDGTGNLAAQVSPHTFDKYKDIIYDLGGKPIVAYGKFAKEGKKLYVELIEIANQTKDIYNLHKLLKDGKTVIISSSPAVSKKGNSYYRLKLNKADGLCFKAPDKLYAGQEVAYFQDTEPFLDIRLI